MVDLMNPTKKDSDPGRKDLHPAPLAPKYGDAIEARVPERASIDHPNWILDRVTSGTYPESTQVAMSRQFARVLGDMLGKNTNNRGESVAVLGEALQTRVRVPNFEKHLHDAIDTVCQARNLGEASVYLAHNMSVKLDGLPLSDKLTGVHALMRQTVVKMFDNMMDSPHDPHTLMSVSGDGSMHTVFGLHGNVTKMGIKMTAGRLSHYFKEALTEAQRAYGEKKEALRNGRMIEDDKVFELTLTVDRMDPRTRELSRELLPVKTTKEDLIASYTSALTRYAATAYADRVREAAKAIE